MNLTALSKPFPGDRISWRVGSTTADKKKGMALAYIDAHLSEPTLTASRIAEAQHLSRRRLDDILLKATGSSLTRHIWLHRLTQAQTLLLDSRQASRSTGDVAFDCGFIDTAHFARAFKRQFGCTPKELRNRAHIAGDN